MNKKKFILAAVMLTAVATLLCAAFTTSKPALAETNALKVRGEGTVTMVPDVAVLHLGVQLRDTDAAVAQTNAAAVMERLIAMLLDQNVDQQDIQTSHYSVYPDYHYEKGTSELNGYSVSSSLTVKVRAVSTAADLLQQAVRLGANTGSGISYELADSSAAYRRALQLAIMDAAEKAQELADSMGLDELQLIKIKEAEHAYGWTRRGLTNAAMDSATGGLMAGKLDVSAAVEVTYAF